nr:hypothetical protein [Tanacetum cinerariifolium]
RTFTLVGNVCPLTRIATATIVPPREPIPIVKSIDKPVVTLVVQIVLWYLDSGCSKHMTGDRSQLINFVQKFLGTVKFGNDHVAKIMGYGDYQIRNVTISRVYYVFCFQRLSKDVYQEHCHPKASGRSSTGSGKLPEEAQSYEARHVPTRSEATVGISHQVSSVQTPQQNGVVERRNQTLVKAARTLLIFSRAPLFLWAEAIATACFTQNRSIIHCYFNKTPYELNNKRKLDIVFLYVFGALCYPKNDRQDIGKLGAKGDISFFIGYSADSCTYKVFNQRTNKIMETMNVSFDEILAKSFEQRSLKLGLQSMTSRQISSGLDLTYAPSTITTQQPTEGELDLLFEAMYDDYIGGQPSATPRIDVDGLNSQQQHAQQQGYQAPIQLKIVANNVPNAIFDANTFVNPFATPSTSA